MHLFAARFEEQNGDPNSARAILTTLLNDIAPQAFQVVSALANFERRQGNKDAAWQVYATALAESAAKVDSGDQGDGKSGSDHVFLVL